MSNDINLNIRIPRKLKSSLDSFAKQHGVPVTTLLLNEIELLIARGEPRRNITIPTKKLNRAVSRTAERVL